VIHDTHLSKKILVQSSARVFLVLYEISDGLLIFERVTHWEGFPEHDNQPINFQATPLELLKRMLWLYGYGFAWVDPGESDIYLNIPIHLHIHIPYISIPNSIYVSTGNRIYSIIFYVFLYLIIPTAAPIFIYVYI
jgi:hypothetical protein